MTLPQIEELSKKAIELRGKATQGEWDSSLVGTVISKGEMIAHTWNHGTKGYTDIICKSSIPHNVSTDDQINMKLIAFSANHITEIAEMNLRLMKALEKCKEQRDQARLHMKEDYPMERQFLKDADNDEIQAILEGRDV